MDAVELIATKFSVHLCGEVIQYRDYREMPSPKEKKDYPKADQNASKKNRAKRAIKDACCYLSLHSINKPTLFVLTCPVVSDSSTENKNVSKFFNNFTKPHSWGRCEHYVWVREYQPSGRPHWHVVADVPRFPIKKINMYWAGLWGTEQINCVRLHPKGTRFLRKNYLAAANYLAKYFTKNTEKNEKQTNSNRERPDLGKEYTGKSINVQGLGRCSEDDNNKVKGRSDNEGINSPVRIRDGKIRIRNNRARVFAISNNLRQKSNPRTLSAAFDSDEINEILEKKKCVFFKNHVYYYR